MPVERVDEENRFFLHANIWLPFWQMKYKNHFFFYSCEYRSNGMRKKDEDKNRTLTTIFSFPLWYFALSLSFFSRFTDYLWIEEIPLNVLLITN